MGPAGDQANGSSYAPSVSADGRYVAFHSSASNLVGDDTNGATDAFVRDRTAGTTARVSVGASGAQADAGSSYAVIAGNGGSVAFQSSASNLVAGDTNSSIDVFIRSLAGATTTRASVGGAGAQAAGTSTSPSISSDGARIAFQTTAALAAGDGDGESDIYVRDRGADTTTWASAWAANRVGPGGGSSSPSISGDGRYVGLALDSDVHLNDTNGARDIYEYGLETGVWAHISRDDELGPGNLASDAPSLSADGLYAAFESLSTNLHPYGDTNGVRDIFLHEWSDGPAPDLPARSSGAAARSGSTDEQPPPCSVGKPDAAGSGSSGAGSGDAQAKSEAASVEREVCRILPVPPGVGCVAQCMNDKVGVCPSGPGSLACQAGVLAYCIFKCRFG